MSRQPVTRTAAEWYEPRLDARLLGINLGWLNKHDGNQSTNWLGSDYDATKIEADLDLIVSLGLTKIRAFIQIESVMGYSSGFSWNTTARANLHDFLQMVSDKNLQIIAVMNSGNHDGSYASLDGKFRWDLCTTPSGIAEYVAAQTLYINEYKSYPILMFELANEPYGELTWSAGAIASGATIADMHNFLKASYDNAKSLTDIYCGFSDIEESQQEVYQIIESDTFRTNYVDDCTDVYSMHIYRPDQSYIADFGRVTDKPKWCTELGAINYNDPTASSHPVAGRNELYDESSNFASTVSIARKLQASGFELIMPWSISDNSGLITHNADGTHTQKKLLKFIDSLTTGRSSVSGTRTTA